MGAMMLLALAIGTLVHIVVALLILAVVVGLLNFLITKAPETLIAAPYKEWIRYVLLVLVVIVIIGMLLHYTGVYTF